MGHGSSPLLWRLEFKPMPAAGEGALKPQAPRAMARGLFAEAGDRKSRGPTTHFSTAIDMPMPPPMQSVARALPPPRRFSS